MIAYVLRINYFGFDCKVQKQISGTTILTKYTPSYTSIYMEKYEKFFSFRTGKSLVWFMYIDEFFFIWKPGEKKLQKGLEDLNNNQPKIKLIFTSSRECSPFLDLDMNLSDGEYTTDLHIKPTDRCQ